MNESSLTILITTLVTVIVSTVVPTVISYLIKRKFDVYFKAKEEKELRHQRDLEELTKLRDAKIREDRKHDTEEIIKQAIEPLKKDLELLKKSNQQTLRNTLLQMYDKYLKLGYCPLEEKNRFDLMFQVYHSLGKNGVMDECHRKLMSLPDDKVVSKKTKQRLNEDK